MADAVGRLWARARGQAAAGHLHGRFFPQDDGVTMTPDDSYLRIWLSELFLAKAASWGADRTPAVEAAVRLVAGGQAPGSFVTLVQPPVPAGRGASEDYQLTGLLPYRGGPVELQATLHQILGRNHLGTAIDILAGFASLLTPPLSAALAIAGQVAAGVEKIVEANAQDPVLALHAARMAPGAGGPGELRPGWLAVVRATADELPGEELHLDDGRLCRNGRRLTGYDYMVLRIEGRRERDDWRTPDLDKAIQTATWAKATIRSGEYGSGEYRRLRDEALSKIYFSADLTSPQRRQLAAAVRGELDAVGPGAVADREPTVADIVAGRGLPSRDSVAGLTLAGLLSL